MDKFDKQRRTEDRIKWLSNLILFIVGVIMLRFFLVGVIGHILLTGG